MTLPSIFFKDAEKKLFPAKKEKFATKDPTLS